MRTHAARLVPIAILLALLAGLGPLVPTAYACTQPPGGHPVIPIEERARQADVVLVGTITNVNRTPPMPEATVHVESYLKGRGLGEVIIGPFGGGTLCQNTVAVGERWVFFARGDAMSGRLTAQYLSAGDAITTADPATIAKLTAYIGHPPVPPIVPPDAPRACPQLIGRVAPAVIDAALASPDRVNGWQQRQNPNLPADPYMNPLARNLTLRSPAQPWHPLYNGLVYRTGCP
jgi:hypothetical protein